MSHLVRPPPPPRLDDAALSAAFQDLCEYHFVILERRSHAHQLVATPRARSLGTRSPAPSPAGWRVDLE